MRRSLFCLRVLGALTLMALALGVVSAGPITKTVLVNVYQLCDDSGLNCASTGPSGDSYFTAETNKIWAQAGIGVIFSALTQINSTLFSTIDDSSLNHTFAQLTSTYGTHGLTVDLFLVHTIAGAYGEAWLGAGGLAVAMDSVMAYPPAGRIDTIAHELGHNFNLPHSGTADYLMAEGGIRTPASDLANINPDGAQLDKLSAAEIAIALDSTLLQDVPEPASVALIATGLCAVMLIRRRRV